MRALELAHYMEDTERWNVAGVQMQNCAEMLRRQHEAIQKLRKALDDIAAFYPNSQAAEWAKQALRDTEGLV